MGFLGRRMVLEEGLPRLFAVECWCGEGERWRFMGEAQGLKELHE